MKPSYCLRTFFHSTLLMSLLLWDLSAVGQVGQTDQKSAATSNYSDDSIDAASKKLISELQNKKTSVVKLTPVHFSTEGSKDFRRRLRLVVKALEGKKQSYTLDLSENRLTSAQLDHVSSSQPGGPA